MCCCLNFVRKEHSASRTPLKEENKSVKEKVYTNGDQFMTFKANLKLKVSLPEWPVLNESTFKT